MGLTKTDLFTAQQNQLATWAKVLGHPARIAILHYLLKQNTCVCGSLVDELGLAQATISQHLRELKDAGFITGSTIHLDGGTYAASGWKRRRSDGAWLL